MATRATFLLSVRHYPSQWVVGLGLLPTMILTFLTLCGAFAQEIGPGRWLGKPHASPLFYDDVMASFTRLCEVPLMKRN